ncbi:MAG: aminotransferase class I/II-fold pyridoxal phosphate-dependent enzyme [Actinomycetota bacterium]
MTFTPPPYPYDRLDALRETAKGIFGRVIDCSIGTPCDPPPADVVAALGTSGLERGYPTSAGSPQLRTAMSNYMARRFGVEVSPEGVGACVGTKEFVASTAQYLHLRDPEHDTVLFPEISYPTYAMGATLAGLRSVPVPTGANGALLLDEISGADADRALCLWTNSPSNPTGALDDLEAAAEWGRARQVPVLSDECYAEFTWSKPPQTILSGGMSGVLAVHSISKRSNLAGIRCGFYTGDPELVSFLRGVRQHAGLMVPGPVQTAVEVAYNDDLHVEQQRVIYLRRLNKLAEALTVAGIPATIPEGTFYLWVPVPSGESDAWTLAARLAEQSGLIVSPGDLYGEAGKHFIRIALVVDDDDLDLVCERLS